MTTETVTTKPAAEGTRPADFKHIYAGKFKDHTPKIRPAGILTYSTSGDTARLAMQQNHLLEQEQAHAHAISLSPCEQRVDKFRQYTNPDLGRIRVHYGHANDSKQYEIMSHGTRSDENALTAKDSVNPKPLSKFETQQHNISERMYLSHKSAPLGHITQRHQNLPSTIDPNVETFGTPSVKSEQARDIVNPDKLRHIVEKEASYKKDMYIKSHNSYEPGAQKHRNFVSPFSPDTCWGVTQPVFYDGRQTKQSLLWHTQLQQEKRASFDAALPLDVFREKHTAQIGKPLDPNKDTRAQLSPDHVFGLLPSKDNLGAGDVIHSRNIERSLSRGKDKERAYLASLRNYLQRYNYTKHKTLVDAFKFYDKDRDGFISKEELRNACANSGIPIGDELLDSLIHESDVDDGDGRLSFLEFVNSLCYKDAMKTGLNIEGSNDEVLRDQEGRCLLPRDDLVPKHNIKGNELVPRTLVKQVDEKVGEWKTTYDVINDAPFRKEPLAKRVYGIPSIRNDLPAPEPKKIQDKTNYGNEGVAWSLLSPSIFAHHGIYEKDMLKPRSKEVLQGIFKRAGYNVVDKLSPSEFDQVWQHAAKQNPYGEVSVEEFRCALEQLSLKQNDCTNVNADGAQCQQLLSA